MDTDKYKELWRIAHELDKTSSILNVENNSLTFARTSKYLKHLKNTDKTVHVIVPHDIPEDAVNSLPSNIKVHILDPGDDIQYVFTYLHNDINRNKEPKPNVIGDNCNIHSTAVIGVHGNTYCNCPDGSKLNLKHMGNVVIEDNVDVEALSIVHRASLYSTVIKEGAKVCVKVNVGHNCCVGRRTIIAPGVLLGGGAIIGNDCYIWQGVIIRSQTAICDNVIVGAGSVVMKDITEPGVYYGSPAKYIKKYNPKLR